MTASPVPAATLRRIVEGATRAPSMHNTQPWLWRAHARTLDLYADRSRRLGTTDPDGRNLVISCGAALHHVQVVAGALGWHSEVTRFPDVSSPDLLARIRLTPAPRSPDAGRLLETVARRATDRRRFTSWPVPPERLEQLASVATHHGTIGCAVTDIADRVRAERIIGRAGDLQAAQRPFVEEQASWVGRSTPDGVPTGVLVGAGAGPYPDRFVTRPDTDLADQDVETTDGLVVLCGREDAPREWLAAGEGLSALLLSATTGGLSAVPLSQVTEVDETREAFRNRVLHGQGHPLLLVRVGWQAIGRRTLPRTPRRPVDEVLHIA